MTVLDIQDEYVQSVFTGLEEFEKELEKEVPNPSRTRLISTTEEYSPTELSDMLQAFGSYVSTLTHMEALLEAQCHALKESYKTGISIAASRLESRTTTQSGREAEVLSGEELFRQTRRLQIDHESRLILIKGWRSSYDNAWATISRIISLRIGEASLQTGRHP